jgi:hypothetical protein
VTGSHLDSKGPLKCPFFVRGLRPLFRPPCKSRDGPEPVEGPFDIRSYHLPFLKCQPLSISSDLNPVDYTSDLPLISINVIKTIAPPRHAEPPNWIRRLGLSIQNPFQPFLKPERVKPNSSGGLGPKRKRSSLVTWPNCVNCRNLGNMGNASFLLLRVTRGTSRELAPIEAKGVRAELAEESVPGCHFDSKGHWSCPFFARGRSCLRALRIGREDLCLASHMVFV